jgi:hypothetical protein
VPAAWEGGVCAGVEGGTRASANGHIVVQIQADVAFIVETNATVVPACAYRQAQWGEMRGFVRRPLGASCRLLRHTYRRPSRQRSHGHAVPRAEREPPRSSPARRLGRCPHQDE